MRGPKTTKGRRETEYLNVCRHCQQRWRAGCLGTAHTRRAEGLMSHRFLRPGVSSGQAFRPLTSPKERHSQSCSNASIFLLWLFTPQPQLQPHPGPSIPHPSLFHPPAWTASPSPQAPGEPQSVMVMLPTRTLKQGLLFITVTMGTSRNKKTRETLKSCK